MPETLRKPAQRVHVGNIDDLEHGGIRLVEVGSREIGLVRWDDTVYAVRNVCPHVAGPACGLVRPRLSSDSAQQTLAVDSTRPMLVCAWHKWEFDLRDGGRALFDPRLRVKTYPVDMEPDGSLWISV